MVAIAKELLSRPFRQKPQAVEVSAAPQPSEERIVTPASGEEKTRLLSLAREVISGSHFDGIAFNTFTDTMISLLGGWTRPEFDSSTNIDDETGRSFDLLRVKPHDEMFLDYSRITVRPAWYNLPKGEATAEDINALSVVEQIDYGKVTSGGSSTNTNSQAEVRYDFYIPANYNEPTFSSVIDGDTPLYTKRNEGRELHPQEVQKVAAKIFELYEKRSISFPTDNNGDRSGGGDY